MKKLLSLLLLGLIITSCSQDEGLIDQSANAKLLLEDNSGQQVTTDLYKGTFLALRTQLRGNVVVWLNQTNARASITLSDNTELKFEALTPEYTQGDSKSILFQSEVGNFTLTTDANGNNPQVTDLSVLGLDGGIVIKRDVPSLTIRTMTGTFGCEDCGGHPVMSDPNAQENFVWNMIFTSNVSGEIVDIFTQVSYGTKTINGSGLLDNSIIGLGGMMYSDISGNYKFGADGNVYWSGQHMMAQDGSCESLNGSWNFITPAYNINGWLRSDIQCATGDDDDDDDDDGDDDGDDDDDDSEYTYCNDAETKVLICHGGNTLCVSVHAVAAHLAHGDQLGSCDD